MFPSHDNEKKSVNFNQVTVKLPIEVKSIVKNIIKKEKSGLKLTKGNTT